MTRDRALYAAGTLIFLLTCAAWAGVGWAGDVLRYAAVGGAVVGLVVLGAWLGLPGRYRLPRMRK